MWEDLGLYNYSTPGYLGEIFTPHLLLALHLLYACQTHIPTHTFLPATARNAVNSCIKITAWHGAIKHTMTADYSCTHMCSKERIHQQWSAAVSKGKVTGIAPLCQHGCDVCYTGGGGSLSCSLIPSVFTRASKSDYICPSIGMQIYATRLSTKQFAVARLWMESSHLLRGGNLYRCCWATVMNPVLYQQWWASLWVNIRDVVGMFFWSTLADFKVMSPLDTHCGGLQ